MMFKDVIGQEAVKHKLILSVQENRVPHAQLFLGPAGSGKLGLALAYAQYILCPNHTETDSCGICPNCKKISKLIHPDLHFVFPSATTKKVKKDPESDQFMEEWRGYVTETKAYADTSTWYNYLDVENKQGAIFVRDASTLLRKLSFKAYEGDYKFAIIWMAEKLRIDTANKLLKLLEEPPEKTIFILIAEDQEQILPTIKSRTSLLKVPRISLDSIEKELELQFDCSAQEAHDAAILSEGNWINACRYLNNHEDEKFFFQTFQQWMRICFKAGVNEMIDLANNIKTIGREKQKDLLEYGLNVIRNSLLYNNNLSNLVMLPEDEKKFNSNFAPFINPNNLMQIAALLEEGMKQIERNGYAPIIFLDISFKMAKLLKIKA
jgi:DNA polymerase III, gamma/tau subunits